jgi:transcription initiation factor TFIIIB Brf1 subunit/transcription initiation factor TFIIB
MKKSSYLCSRCQSDRIDKEKNERGDIYFICRTCGCLEVKKQLELNDEKEREALKKGSEF